MPSLKFKKIAILVFLFSCASKAFSAEYSFPLQLRLGAGVNPAEPLDAFPYCFDYRERLVSGAAATSQFRASVVKDRREFLRELSVSASASGSYTFFSANASATVDERYSFSDDSITWIVQFTSNLGRKEIYDEKLKPGPQALLTAGKHKEFATRCGTELISQEERRIAVAAVFTANNLSRSQKVALQAKLGGGTSGGAWNAEASVSFRSLAEEASKISRINVEVITIGGPGPTDLAPLFTDMGDINQISAILKQYALKINFDNAKATSYYSTKMTRYGWNGSSIEGGVQEIAIGDYYMLYRDTESVKQRAAALLQQHDSRSIKLSDTQVDSVKTAFSKSDTLIRNVVEVAQACRANATNCRPVSDFARVSPNWPKLEPIGLVTQSQKRLDCSEIALSPNITYACKQAVKLLGFARWSEIAGVDISDSFGQRVPLSYGGSYSMQSAYVSFKGQLGVDLSEPRFLELATGEQLSTFAEAESKGWGAREIDLNFMFGAQAPNTAGLRTTLNILFASPNGNVTERKLLMY